jgi:hypothetical protein
MKRILVAILALLAAGLIIFFSLSQNMAEANKILNPDGSTQANVDPLKGIEDQVAVDAVKQYGIAQRSGTAVDRCVHAGLVAAAYIQAKDEPNYRVWKRTERMDCKAAGMPNQ